MTTVVVKPGMTLTIGQHGMNFVYIAGDSAKVPTFEVARLRLAGVIV